MEFLNGRTVRTSYIEMLPISKSPRRPPELINARDTDVHDSSLLWSCENCFKKWKMKDGTLSSENPTLESSLSTHVIDHGIGDQIPQIVLLPSFRSEDDVCGGHSLLRKHVDFPLPRHELVEDTLVCKIFLYNYTIVVIAG